MSRIPPRRALAALAIAIAASAAPAARASHPCFAPIVDAYTVDSNGFRYSQGGSVDIWWTAVEGSAYQIQIANDSAFSSIVRTITPIGANLTEWPISGLQERRYHYRMRALGEPGGCVTGPWGNKIAVIQDSTGPVVTIENTSTDVCGVPVAPATPVYCFEDEVMLIGTAIDRPAPSAPSGVGAAQVSLALQNTTPVLGGGQPKFVTVSVDEGGTWLLRLKGAEKPASGMYAASAQGIDRLGNPSENAALLAYIVIL